MAAFLADARYAFRLLRKSPAFALCAIAVLALGIGANAAVFSALDQTVIRPLPYADPDRLATLWEDFSVFGMPRNRVSPATFYDWRRRMHAFADLAALRVSGMDLSESGPPEQVLGAATTANLLPLLGVSPLAGRVLSVDEEPPGHRVVVISYRLWQRRYAGDPGLVGRPIVMSDERYTVVGVMPAGFHFPDGRTDFWVPIAFSPQQLTARNSHYLRVIGRLGPGASWAAARDDMGEIARQLAREFPASNDRIGVAVTPLKEEIAADTGRALTLLLGAAACVLLVACANVANLLLARASRRRREIALRLALGASAGRVVRQLLTESFLLSVAGGLAGLFVASWSLQALTRFVPAALSGSVVLRLDARAMIFASMTTAVTALLFGSAPAVQLAFRSHARQGFNAGVGVTTEPRSARMNRVLVVAEISVALVLVVGAALLMETLIRLRGIDPGFRADHLLTGEITVRYPKYAEPQRRARFYSDVLAGVGAIRGVERAGLTSDLPYTSRGNYMSLRLEHEDRPNALGQDALFRLVSAGYLPTIGAKLREGRFLDDRDRADTTPVVVVNEALARDHWPGQSALGRRIDTGTGDGAPLWMTIVGVVEDIKERGLDLGPKAAVYVPFTQTAIGFFQPSEIAIRTDVPPKDLAGALQKAVWAVDPEQPVSAIRTMDDIVDVELANRQQMLTLVGAFAGLALLLCAVGVYGVLSYLVSESRRDIGVRLAIGASPGLIVRGILRHAAVMTTLGIGVGILAAVATTRLLGSLLFGVSPVDPGVLAAVSLFIGIVSLAASYLPARRAAGVDPAVVLRGD